MPGKLINFEGIDFCGKSVQANLLYKKLLDLNIPAVLLRDPGGTHISEEIRAIVLDNKHHNMSSQAELLLYSAARTQMVSEEIIPRLEAGNVVICDRFYDSTTAYQGYGRKIDLNFIKQLNTFVTYGLRPHLTVLIDLKPEVALERNRAAGGKLDRLEQETFEFHQRVRDGYLELASSAAEKDRFVVIDGATSIGHIHENVLTTIKRRFQYDI